MQNFYEILGVASSSSLQEIKSSYQKLALAYHPDKPNGNANKFILLQKAYETLSCLELRNAYDTLLKAQSCHGVIQDHVAICEFKYDKSAQEYAYACRCGSFFAISDEEWQMGINILECEGCSLCIKVLE